MLYDVPKRKVNFVLYFGRGPQDSRQWPNLFVIFFFNNQDSKNPVELAVA